MWTDYGMGWGWAAFGAAHMLLWWVLIGLGIVVLLKWLIGGSFSNEQRSASRALELLNARYAQGEIGKEEYGQKKRDLLH